VVRTFLTPKWLLRHAVAVVGVVICLRLGWWQIEEAFATRDPQNIGYALEWPVFALAVVFVWVRLVQWEINPPQRAGRLTAPLHKSPPKAPAPVAPAAATPATAAAPATQATAATPATAAADAAEPDDRHARYNRWLAELAASDEAHR
jgi:DNA-binding transcriptional regulator of glucitol operon